MERDEIVNKNIAHNAGIAVIADVLNSWMAAWKPMERLAVVCL